MVGFSAAEQFNSVMNISGWFYLEDAIILHEINRLQCESKIAGDLLEIGVYQGKTAAFLGFFVGCNERLVVCDTFEQEAMDADNQSEKSTWYPDIQRGIFEKNYLEIHHCLPQIVACHSPLLHRIARLDRTFRLIHIDGSHLYSIVYHDLQTAARLLLPGGIVAIDDYRSAHTPGVAAATWEAVFQGKLVPICVTSQKMYASTDPRAKGLPSKVYEWAVTQKELVVAAEKIHGKQILRFSAIQ